MCMTDNNTVTDINVQDVQLPWAPGRLFECPEINVPDCSGLFRINIRPVDVPDVNIRQEALYSTLSSIVNPENCYFRLSALLIFPDSYFLFLKNIPHPRENKGLSHLFFRILRN